MPQTIQNTVRISPPSDHALLRFFDTLCGDNPDSHFLVQVPGRQIGAEFHSLEAFGQQFDIVKFKSSSIISLISARIWLGAQYVVEFHRYITDYGQGGTQVDRPSMWEGEITVFPANTQQVDANSLAQLWFSVDGLRTEVVAHARPGQLAPSEGLDLAAQQLVKLTELHANILEDAEAARLKIETTYAERAGALEAAWQRKHDDLEVEVAVERSNLRDREIELATRQKELDDRGHMHARRELRAQITQDLAERLRRPMVSRNSTLLRSLITAASACGALAFGAYAFSAAADIHQLFAAINAPGITPARQYPPVELVYIALGRFAVAAAGAAGFLVYMLGWLRRIQSEDVRAERDLERYRYDVDRASWAIETILEAQTKEAGVVPDRWIEGVTHGLFSRIEEPSDDGGALQVMSELLNVAARAKIGPGGTELEINRGGLRKLAKDTQ